MDAEKRRALSTGLSIMGLVWYDEATDQDQLPYTSESLSDIAWWLNVDLIPTGYSEYARWNLDYCRQIYQALRHLVAHPSDPVFHYVDQVRVGFHEALPPQLARYVADAL